MYLHIICLLFICFSYGVSQVLRSAREEGDVIIGALFPVHHGPTNITGYTRTCGKVWEQYGIHRIEIFLRTLETINNDPTILPNITLGYDIRDSCWYSPIALEQSIDFIKDSIASINEIDSAVLNSSDKCKTEHKRPIVGLIGPGTSQNTIQVQNLLQIFKLPQIGYSATSMELSDKNLYKYFLRVVPSDRYQARALLDVLIHYNWTYISTVHTDNNYGARGMQKFSELTRETDICIASDEKISSLTADENTYISVVEALMKTSKAQVIVCFCDGLTVNGLYKATAKVKGALNHFLILGSDGWADRPDVVKNIEKEVAGGMSIKLYSPVIKDFDKFFLSLDPFNNTKNPWFQEFWEEKFNCFFEGSGNRHQSLKRCQGNEKRDSGDKFVQDSKLGFVVNAIYTMAYALHNMHKDICGGVPGMCPEMFPVEGSLYLTYLLNVSMVTYSQDELIFDANGDPTARYDIMNFQKFVDDNGTVSYGYVQVGSWKTGVLTINDSMVYWPNNERRKKIRSVCSDPCPRGSVKYIEGNKKCCWSCIPCKENEIMLDATNCKKCSKGWWPNEELTACKMINVEYLSWFDNEAMMAIALACFGIFVTLWIGAIFLRHHNTPVVKASTRELSYIIMIGIIMSYSSNFVLVAKPTIVTCYFTRILPWLSFALIYGALVTKTNRIARILEGTKKIITKKPRFMSASAQVIITCILVGIECAIITVMLIIEPADSKLDYPSTKRVRLICNTTTLGIVVPLGFDLVLIVMCTLYAIKTRNLPENFNEAKFIGFTMYTTCVIWLGFFAIYFGSEPRVLTLSISVSLCASVSLVLLFFPKVYVIVWAPEKNTRSAFTTSKDLRCHIGSTSYPSDNSVEFGKDKRLLDSSGNLLKKKFKLGKLKHASKDNAQSRRHTYSLPPSMKLNRQNSTHVPAASSGNNKFPWKKKDAARSEDEDDRLSTISSREESRNGSERRKTKCQVHQTDSECQTDDILFKKYVSKSQLRRRRRSNLSKKSSSDSNSRDESESSINSDEIFLSLPLPDAGDNRGMYKLSPRHSDRSPLLKKGDSDATDDVDEIDSFPYRHNITPDFKENRKYQEKVSLHCAPSTNKRNESVSSNRTNSEKPLIINTSTTDNKTSLDHTHNLGHDNQNQSPRFLDNAPLIVFSDHHDANEKTCDGAQVYNDKKRCYGNSGAIYTSVPRREGLVSDLDKQLPDFSNDFDTYKGCETYPFPDVKRPNEPGIAGIPQTTIPTYNQSPFGKTNVEQRPDKIQSIPCQKTPAKSLADIGADAGLDRIEEEEVSMMSFRDYMKNRGIDLDMTNIQSSEV